MSTRSRSIGPTRPPLAQESTFARLLIDTGLAVMYNLGARKLEAMKNHRQLSESTTTFIVDVVQQAIELRDLHIDAFQGHVSYCCIFCQSELQYHELRTEFENAAKLAKTTETGPVFVCSPIPTAAGELRIIKIRKPDSTRTELGDADFATRDYVNFKTAHLGESGFKLIERSDFEMLELVDPDYSVRCYFSNPPVEQHPGVREALAEEK